MDKMDIQNVLLKIVLCINKFNTITIINQNQIVPLEIVLCIMGKFVLPDSVLPTNIVLETNVAEEDVDK